MSLFGGKTKTSQITYVDSEGATQNLEPTLNQLIETNFGLLTLTGSLTFHVQTNGDDGNDGLTVGTAWATLARVFEEINKYRILTGAGCINVLLGAGRFSINNNTISNSTWESGCLSFQGQGATTIIETVGYAQILLTANNLFTEVQFQNLKFEGFGLQFGQGYFFFINVNFFLFFNNVRSIDSRLAFINTTLENTGNREFFLNAQNSDVTFNGFVNDTIGANYTEGFLVGDRTTFNFVDAYNLVGGNSTGKKYNLINNSSIIGIGGSSVVPGSVEGDLDESSIAFGKNYDNSSSGLVADKKSQAIDELKTIIDNLESRINILEGN